MKMIVKSPILSLLAAGLAAVAAPYAAADGGGRTLFVESAVEAGNTASLPLHQGVSNGRKVWYVLLDASDGKDAASYRVNHAAKLANVRGSAATQKVSVVGGVVQFPAAVDFTPDRHVLPGPTGFPPLAADPGSLGETGYSPLIEFPDGRILNAPIIGIGELSEIAYDPQHRSSHDKVVAVDVANLRVSLAETGGFAGGKAVRYVSTDASVGAVAALEGSTLAPALGAAPAAGGDGSDSGRASLAAFVNGQTGSSNPQRQGLNSALLDGAEPLNVLAWNPSQGRYSPLWDVHPAEWSAATVAAGQNLRQSDFGQVRNLAAKGIIGNPQVFGGGPFTHFPGAQGAVVNCPIISQD